MTLLELKKTKLKKACITIIERGMVNPEITFISLFNRTNKTVITAIKETDFKRFKISVKPVCLITLLKEPLTKKLIADTTNTKGI